MIKPVVIAVTGLLAIPLPTDGHPIRNDRSHHVRVTDCKRKSKRMILTREKIRVNNISIGGQYGVQNTVSLAITPPKIGWYWNVDTITFEFDTPGPDFHQRLVLYNPKLELDISGSTINIALPLIQRPLDQAIVWPIVLADGQPPLQSGSVNYPGSQIITWRDTPKATISGGFTTMEVFIPNALDLTMAVTLWGQRERV